MRTSRLTARVGNNAVDQIVLHSFVLARDGEWAIVQQGMNDRRSFLFVELDAR